MSETPVKPVDAAEPAHDDPRVIRERRDKARRLAEGGLCLYAQGFVPTHDSATARGESEALIASARPIAMAGRVVLHRPMGKAGFLTFIDCGGRFQAYIKKGVTEEAGFDYFNKSMDAGDIVGVEGPLFITKKGELTVQADRLRLLTKAIRPLPEKWRGLQDVELRYRHRYVDLIVNPEVRETFRVRSGAISAMRRMLDAKGYMEVETPMMQLIYGGASARPFRTHLNALDLDLFLRIAPELFLKRLLVGGLERVYEINRNFRNEGLSVRHNPEFTMLELYTAYGDYVQTMDLTEELLRETAREVMGKTEVAWRDKSVDFGPPFERKRMIDLIAGALEIDATASRLRWGMESKGGAIEAIGPAIERARGRSEEAGRAIDTAGSADELLFALFEHLVEPTLWRPTFVHDFPKSLCPLARSAESDEAVAERFELFAGGLELANAYTELNDPEEQLARFQEQVKRRAAGDEEAMSEVDADYIEALEYGMPPAGGLGIGIDRFVMVLTDSRSIRDVILFPLMRPAARS